MLFFFQNRTWRFRSRYQILDASQPFGLYRFYGYLLLSLLLFFHLNFPLFISVPTYNTIVEWVETVLRLHNTVEDLKGSIRVFCRVRPLNEYLRQVLSVESHVATR